MRVLVTAGPTCEDLDDVRCLTNRSSGRTGYAVAAEALRRGHGVELVSGPVEIEPPAGARLTRIWSAADLLRECRRLFPACDALVMAAAVADYRPAERAAGKLKKSGGELVLRLVPTADVLAELGRAKRPGQVLVGFALESAAAAESRRSAEQKLVAKHLDLIVLNGPAALGAAEAEVSLLAAGSAWRGPLRLGKAELAREILDFIEKRGQAPSSGEQHP